GPTAWRKPASACSPSLACRQANGRAPAPPTPSSVCTRSSSGGSRRRPCCHRPRLRPCCSGRCSQQARSRCARLTAGTHLASPSPTNPLTSPHEPIISNRRRAPRQIHHSPRRHLRKYDRLQILIAFPNSQLGRRLGVHLVLQGKTRCEVSHLTGPRLRAVGEGAGGETVP